MNAKAIRYIDNIQSRYERLGYAPYRWLYADEAPAFTSIAKPISESRLGVVTTAGAYVAGQVAFHYKDDTSVRAIPSTTATEIAWILDSGSFDFPRPVASISIDSSDA